MTFLDNSSVWTELNTYTVARLFQDGMAAEEAICGFAREYLELPDAAHQ